MKKKIAQITISILAIVMVFFISAYTNSHPLKSAASADLETIKKRIVDDLLTPSVNATRINKLVNTISADGSWPGINYKDTTKTGFEHRIHLENLLDLAIAFKKPGSAFQGNPAVKKTALAALDFWIAHDFICENWWWNEMGTPNWMINTLLLLDTELSQNERTAGAKIASRASLTGVGARAGGDFVPIAGMICKQGLFKDNDSILRNAIKVMGAQVIITPARGINPDMGFHHRTDNVTSIHTYGTNYVSAFAYWAVKTAGTKYSLSPDALKLLIDYYIDGITKCMAYGIYPDPGAKNRDLSRKGDLGPAGTGIPEDLMRSSDYRKKELQYIVKIRKGEVKPDLTWNRYFWHSSYLAHQRLNYYTSVRMYSSQQNNMEEPYNDEGLKNHHVADGSNFISRTGTEYMEVFPVWDWQKIPGTTVVQKPALPPFKEIAKKGLTDFVGAVTDGQFGATAFDFKSVHDPLTARKSWFFFDHEYVCLGTAINSTAAYPVATTINQCLLKSNVIVKTKTGPQTLDKGSRNLQDVSWVLHDSIAYLFPEPVSINIGNNTASGNWREISHQASASSDLVQKDLFSLWFDHGVKPRSASYAYIVVPAVSQSSADQYSRKPGVTILANNEALQAVHNTGMNVSQVIFYQPGTIKLPGNINLTVKSPCIVMVKLSGNTISKITVADPTEKLKTLQLQVDKPFEVSGIGYKSGWNKERKLSTIEVELPTDVMAGKSVVMDAGR